MANKTKDQLYMLIETWTKEAEEKQVYEFERFRARVIAEHLLISRNLASQYLNELFYEEKLIKIGTHPIYFLAKSGLEEGEQYANLYESVEVFERDWKRRHGKRDVFYELVGSEGSLHYAIEQCKAAVNYPGNGLGILLHGPTGSGKSLLAGKLFAYCKESGLIKEEGRFVTLNCAEYANNPDLFLTSLFGYTKGAYTGADKESKGLLALCDQGMLFLDEVHSLTPQCQEKLFLFMDRGIYHMVGDNREWYHSSVRFVFATTQAPDQALLNTLFRRIPIVIEIPSLQERPLSEKKSLICSLLREEEKKFSRPMRMSEEAYRAMLEYDFPHNVGELKNCIQVGMANAYMRVAAEAGETIDFLLSDLPTALLKDVAVQEGCDPLESERLIPLAQLRLQKGRASKYNGFVQALLHHFARLQKREIQREAFDALADLQLEQYVDFLFFDNAFTHSAQEDALRTLISSMRQHLSRRYRMKELSDNEMKILIRYFIDLLQNERMQEMDEKWDTLANALLQWLSDNDESMMAAAGECCAMVQKRFSLPMRKFEQVTVGLFLRYFCKDQPSNTIPVVIMAHGYSIASGIAELANRFLRHNIFVAIDMPVEMTAEESADLLKQYLNRQKGVHEIIVMVDMGSLEGIASYIGAYPDLDIGIINNVTSKLALDVGALLLEGTAMADVLKQAVSRSQPNYVLIHNRIKPRAILTVCSSGIGVAEKIASLVESSFPNKPDVTVLPISADTLSCWKNSAIFEKYQVLLIIGTLNLQEEDLPFVSIEDIISGKQNDLFFQVLHEWMEEAEMAFFMQNLIRNFSMDHLLGYLTILNPEKIVFYVEEILEKLQKELSFPLSNNVLIGLYVHISCLIERLIIDKHFVYFMNLEAFERDHADFIKLMRRLFHRVCQAYNVKLPTAEIGYLYHYIYRGRSVEKAAVTVEELQWMEQAGFQD